MGLDEVSDVGEQSFTQHTEHPTVAPSRARSILGQSNGEKKCSERWVTVRSRFQRLTFYLVLSLLTKGRHWVLVVRRTFTPDHTNMSTHFLQVLLLGNVVR